MDRIMVFCVNPESCCDYNVYPLAESFEDYIRILLATRHTNTFQQIILWNTKEKYLDFFSILNEVEYQNDPKVVFAIDAIQNQMRLDPMEEPYEYVRNVQRDFPYKKIPFSNEYSTGQ